MKSNKIVIELLKQNTMLIKLLNNSIANNPAPLKDIKIEDAGFCVRDYNILKHQGIETVAELDGLPEEEIRSWRNCGKKSYQTIKSVVSRFGVKIIDTYRR